MRRILISKDSIVSPTYINSVMKLVLLLRPPVVFMLSRNMFQTITNTLNIAMNPIVIMPSRNIFETITKTLNIAMNQQI
jgi:hypothetical protein